MKLLKMRDVAFTVFTPVMRDFQFSTPGMSKTDYYEVWVKYSLRLSRGSGKPLLDWPFTAYGREEDGGGRSAAGAMREASRRAMRDAAAAIVLNFLRQPAAKKYFAETTTADSGRNSP